jgi:ribosome maturation factor RimP
MPPVIDRARLIGAIDPIARGHGAEVVDVEFKSEASGWVLRVYVEKLGSAEKKATTQEAAVDLDLCSNVAKEVSPALDVMDIIPHRYHLEVSSPGIERPLRGEKDFVRFAGQKAKIRTHAAVSGQKVIIGVLGQPKNGMVPVVDGSRTYEIAFDNVSQARLVFEFGPASKPKPGKKSARK